MTGRQLEELRDALCASFDQDSLDQMLRFRLDKDRTHLVGVGNLRTIVFKLIDIAVREGWQTDLIRAALASNPGNPALQHLCKEIADLPHYEECAPPSLTLSGGAGRAVGKYKLVRLVARRDSGMTCLARDTSLAHDVILKSYSFKGGDPDQLGRVADWVLQRARLRHPALVTPIDVVLLDETLYVVTPFLPDVKSLREFLWEGGRPEEPVSPETACHLLSQVALGLSHAHAMGVSHQSLDPWDILIDPNARVWVAGFERAVIYDPHKDRGEFRTLGTLRYFSPEMMLGEPLDAATDVYHVGIILFELLTGVSPFATGVSRMLMASMDSIRLERIADSKLRVICTKCLQQRKEHRFANATELFESLRSSSGKKRWWQVWK